MSIHPPVDAVNPLKICVIASTYPRHSDDYAVPWLRTSVAHLMARGHEVTVLAPSYQGLRDHRIDDVEVVRFRYSPRRWETLTHEGGAPNRIRQPAYQLLGIPYVINGCRVARRLAKQRNFDVIHAHWPFPHEPIGTAAARVNGAPLIMTCHGAEFAIARRKRWVAACLRRSLLRADLLIANSSDTAGKIRALSGCEAEVLPFGSTVQAKNRPPADNPVPRVLFTGRLIPRKGVEYLLRAADIVRRTHPIQVVVTGDGPLREELDGLRRDLRLEETVEFLGFVDNERLDEEYSRCDVWVNPAIVDDRGDTEGLGVGAIEAYAHGKPVVASDVGGIPDAVVQNQTGLLVPEKNPNKLAQAIIDLTTNREKSARLANGGLKLIRERFDWDRITRDLETMYYRSIRAAEAVCVGPIKKRPAPAHGLLSSLFGFRPERRT